MSLARCACKLLTSTIIRLDPKNCKWKHHSLRESVTGFSLLVMQDFNNRIHLGAVPHQKYSYHGGQEMCNSENTALDQNINQLVFRAVHLALKFFLQILKCHCCQSCTSYNGYTIDHTYAQGTPGSGMPFHKIDSAAPQESRKSGHKQLNVYSNLQVFVNQISITFPKR